MKRKKLAAGILSMTVALSVFAGCGNGGETGADAGTASGGENPVQSSETGGETDDGGAAKIEASDLEHADLTMLMVSPNPNEAELDKIAEKMSEITEEKFNVTLHLIAVTPADYANKMNMMLASGDTLDIFQGFSLYGQYVSQNYMMPIEDYEAYYQDALEVLGDRAAVSYNYGHRYGLPFMNLGGTGGDAWGIRKDVLEDAGVKIEDVVTWDDFADMMRKIKEAHPELTPMMGGGTEPAILVSGDMLTGQYPDTVGDFSLVRVWDPLNNQTVTDAFSAEGYKYACDKAWQWAQEGLIGYDEVSTPTELVKAGKCAIMHTINGPVAADELRAGTGYEMVIWAPQTEKCVVTTNNAWTWCVTDYCEYPEQALMVLNELYINADLANLLEWGIEGEHYQIVDAENGIVDFVEGQHMGNVTYYNYIKDNIPNCYLCYTGANETEGKWELYQKFHDEMTVASPYMGFILDQSPIQNEVAACTNIVNKYAVGLLSGQLDPSTEYDKFMQELKANGLDTIVEEAQAQLDAWVAENK